MSRSFYVAVMAGVVKPDTRSPSVSLNGAGEPGLYVTITACPAVTADASVSVSTLPATAAAVTARATPATVAVNWLTVGAAGMMADAKVRATDVPVAVLAPLWAGALGLAQPNHERLITELAMPFLR
jgi:hypothetical protein